MLHRLLIVIDEAANVAPMPALRRHVSEGRGLGVNLLLSVQASSQFDTVYGSSYARELRDTFPAALIMYGAAEMEMLQRAEQWSRETTRRQETFDQASGGKDVVVTSGSQPGLPAAAPTKPRPGPAAAARDGGHHHRAAGLAGVRRTI